MNKKGTMYEDGIISKKRGIIRVLNAAKYSWHGFKFMLKEEAFRQELTLTIVLVPVAFLLEILPVIKLLLIISLLLVMIVEVLNTALETVVNIVSPEFNHYAKMAKDLGSFAVLIALVVAALVWGYGFYLNFA